MAYGTNTTWAVCSTYHTVLKTLPGAAMFGWDMLFDVPYLADWNQIEEYKNKQTTPQDWKTLLVLTGTINQEIMYCCK